MKLINIFIEFFTLGLDIRESLIVAAVNTRIQSDFARSLELVKDIALTDFVGMKFKAERRDSYLLKTFVNDIESSFFLSSEKHLFIIRQTIGDYRRNSL